MQLWEEGRLSRIASLVAVLVVVVVMVGSAVAAVASARGAASASGHNATSDLSPVALAASPAASPVPSGAIVCTATVNSENPENTAIQTEINHLSAGSTLCIGPGTYPEQLSIAKPLTIAGAGNTTIIEPTTVAFNTVDWDSAGSPSATVPCGTNICVPLAAIILVSNTTGWVATSGVTIEDLQVNGSAASPSVACGDDYVGVDFQDSSGELAGASVLSVASPPASFGCQEVSGAVYAYNGYFYSGLTPSPAIAVTVSGSTIAGYQKNAITCDDPGEVCTLTGNTVTGAGATTLNAQNGIQVAYGASATVSGNLVTGNHYTGSGVPDNVDYFSSGVYTATGILVYAPGNNVRVTGNTLSGNDLGIALVGTERATVSDNTIEQGFSYGITFDLNASAAYVGPLYATYPQSEWTTVANGNTFAQVNVGELVYDDNVSVSGGSATAVNVTFESMFDTDASFTNSIESFTAEANVSGALLGNISSYQSVAGEFPVAVGTYALGQDTFTAGAVPVASGGSLDGVLLNVSSASVSHVAVSGFDIGIVVNPAASATVEDSQVTIPSSIDAVAAGIWAGNYAPDPILTTTGNFVFSGDTIAGPGGATCSPNAGGSGIIAAGASLLITDNTVSGFSAVYGTCPGPSTGSGSGYDWWQGSQSVGVLAACAPAATSCRVDGNTITNNAIGVAVVLFGANGGAYEAGPITISNNVISDSGGYGIFTEMGGNGSTPSQPVATSTISGNTIDDTLTGAPAMDLAGEAYAVEDNVLIGTSLTGNQGPTQGEGGPSIATATVEATDYWTYGFSWTYVNLSGNVFLDTEVFCSLSFAPGSESSLACGELATFTETGLPAATNWSVTMDGVTGTTAAPDPIVFDVLNSSSPYPYSVAAISGYVAVPSSGTLSVTGEPVGQTIAFAPGGIVTFTESGLPTGTIWFVNVTDGGSYTSATSTIGFSEFNGDYSYKLGSANTSYAGTGGSFVVNSGPTAQAVSFRLVTYDVTFTETGIPSGLRWWLNISGEPSMSSTNAVLTVPLPNGTYPYVFGGTSVFPSYYSAAPGTVTIHGATEAVSVTFVQVRQVKVTETGLPQGMEWWVNITTGGSYSSTAKTDIFYEPVGTWAYTLAAQNHDYTAQGRSFVVHSPLLQPHKAAQFTATFRLTKYTVAFAESGLPHGAQWCIVVASVGSYCSTGTALHFGLGNGTYTYTVTTRKAHYSAPGGSITVAGAAVAKTVVFTDPPQIVPAGLASPAGAGTLSRPVGPSNALTSVLLVAVVLGLVGAVWTLGRGRRRA